MKVFILVISILLLLEPVSNGAGFIGPGSQDTVYRASDTLKALDDTPCILEGRLLSKLPGRKQRYLFEDESGQVVVKIKKKIFGKNTVTPGNRVRIEGEVEANDKYPNEIEAECLTILE